MSKWINLELGQLITFRRGYDLPKEEMVFGKYPVAASNGIIGYHNQYTNKAPVITIGRSGNVGTPYFYNEDCWAHNTTLVVESFYNCCPKFIYYLLKTLNLQNYRGGSAVPTLNRNHIHPIKVYVPELVADQKAIADVLSSFDDKIELNNKIIKNLEEQAQSLYKHWFIDFEFPDENGKPYKSNGGKFKQSELGLIPEGWKISKLGDLIFKNTKKINNQSDWLNLKIIDLSVMPQFSLNIKDFNKGENFSTNIYELNEYDLLFGSIRSYFGKAGFSPINGAVAGTVHSFKPKNKNNYSYLLELITSNDFIDKTVKLSSGTKMPVINWDTFSSINIRYSNGNVESQFNEIVFSKISQIKNLIIQNQKLAETRDYLLPKLISGEVKVTDIK